MDTVDLLYLGGSLLDLLPASSNFRELLVSFVHVDLHEGVDSHQQMCKHLLTYFMRKSTYAL